MYKEKSFHVRDLQSVLDDLSSARNRYNKVERIFIADGDALIRKTEDWVVLLEHIRSIFPECERVSCYGSPRSILLKSDEDLKRLYELGLTLLYMGLESGSNTVLETMDKGESVSEIVEAALKAKGAGLKLSVTAISGLGGTSLWEEHAIKTGEALSLMKPDYIGLLTLTVVDGTPLYDKCAEGVFEVSDAMAIAKETLLLLENLDSEGSVFRSNHASNYLGLKGMLNDDLEAMKGVLQEALRGEIGYRDERWRGL